MDRRYLDGPVSGWAKAMTRRREPKRGGNELEKGGRSVGLDKRAQAQATSKQTPSEPTLGAFIRLGKVARIRNCYKDQRA